MSLSTHNINNSNENTEEYIKILKARKPLVSPLKSLFKVKAVPERIRSTDRLGEKQTAHLSDDSVGIRLSLGCRPENAF